MYPYFEIDGLKIYLVNIGALISILVYLFLIYKFSKKYQLDFGRYFNYFWLVLFLMILLGIYFGVVFTFKTFIPDISQIVYVIKNQDLSFIGLSLGFLLGHLILFSKLPLVTEKIKWIDVIFYSLMLSLTIFGFFLLLGDNFIGRPTDSAIGVSPINFCPVGDDNCFLPKTKLSAYSKVYPIGVFLSLVALLSFFITIFLHSLFRNKIGLGVLGFIIFLLGLNIVFVFQKYPRYLVIKPFSEYEIRFDVKNYWTLFLILFIIFYYFYLISNDGYRKIKKTISNPKVSQ